MSTGEKGSYEINDHRGRLGTGEEAISKHASENAKAGAIHPNCQEEGRALKKGRDDDLFQKVDDIREGHVSHKQGKEFQFHNAHFPRTLSRTGISPMMPSLNRP